MEYKNLPIKAAKAGIFYIFQVEGYPPGTSLVSMEEACNQGMHEFLTKFFADCSPYETLPVNKPRHQT